MRRSACLLTVVCLLAAPGGASSGQSTAGRDRVLDSARRARVIQRVLDHIRESYVIPDTARRIEAAIRERRDRGEYERVTRGARLADLLTAHLLAASRDKHLQVFFNYEEAAVHRAEPPSPDALAEFRRKEIRQSEGVNHGFKRVERLDGNLGYIRIDRLVDPRWGGDTAASAFTFVANTHALILDLRSCNGGLPEMVAVLATYLVDGAPVHLTDIYDRPTNATQQFWTMPYVPGRRYAGRPVYVLTSRRTASAAEELAYDLQQLKRAAVIGETTAGAANLGGTIRIDEHFQVFVPSGRAINPVTKGNWEGVGVKPDIETTEDEALTRAQIAALETLVAAARDDEWTARWKARLDALKTPSR